jgi:hypothetical protein
MSQYEPNNNAAAIALAWVNGGAKQERERILGLLKAHSNETWEEYNNHQDGCDLCQNYYGIGVAIKLIEGE